ncbi:MAG TPA: DUF2935 domain-containing protein [Mollicutes bacterium]|nr:DUF2935 domain-containing protein [Mollicutes bacterium]
MLSNNETICFWSGIMRDHEEFLTLSLSVNEMELIETANFFKEEFTKIHNLSNNNITGDFINEVMSLLVNFIEFKRYIIQKLLMCAINISLPPSFINHMINEAQEFYETLESIRRPKAVNTVEENIKLHKVWLPDSSGHATSLLMFIDAVEAFDREEARRFACDFNKLFIKANELGIMIDRTNMSNGALKYLNEQSKNKISDFIYFLSRIKELRIQCKLLGNLMPLIPDHMIREAQYYLSSIQSFNE